MAAPSSYGSTFLIRQVPLPSASGGDAHLTVLKELAKIHSSLPSARFTAAPHLVSMPRWRRNEMRRMWAARLIGEQWRRYRHC